MQMRGEIPLVELTDLDAIPHALTGIDVKMNNDLLDVEHVPDVQVEVNGKQKP